MLYPISRRELSKLTYTLGKKDYLHFAFTGFLCIVVSMTFYPLSVSFLDAHVAGVLFCANTFFSRQRMFFYCVSLTGLDDLVLDHELADAIHIGDFAHLQFFLQVVLTEAEAAGEDLCAPFFQCL